MAIASAPFLHPEVLDYDVLAEEFDPEFAAKVVKYSPEERLCLWVLVRAIQDARGQVARVAYADERDAIQAEAAAFLASPVNTGDHTSAEYLCEVLGLDRGAILRRIAACAIGTLWNVKSGNNQKAVVLPRRRLRVCR